MLDLLPGMGLRLQVESLSFEFEAFFLGDDACMASTIREAWAEHAGTELAEAVWLDDSEISARTLAVGGLDPAARVYAGRWLPVTLELVPMPAALSES